MSTATEQPGVNPLPVNPDSEVDLESVAAERRYRPNPADVHRLAPNRDERLFLVLSIFIGVISGLMVVCFRVAINWIQVLTLGSSPHPGQLRLFFVPMGVGLLVAVLVQLVFPPLGAVASTRPRRRSTSTTAISLLERSSGNSLPRRSPSAADSRSVLRILRCKSGPAWPPWSAAASTSRANGYACLPPLAQPRGWRLRSTRLSRPFFS